MKRRGISEHAFAIEAGIYPSSLYRYMRNPSSDTDLKTIRAIAFACNCSVGQLLGETMKSVNPKALAVADLMDDMSEQGRDAMLMLAKALSTRKT